MQNLINSRLGPAPQKLLKDFERINRKVEQSKKYAQGQNPSGSDSQVSAASGPAPGLSYFQISGVNSQQAGLEDLVNFPFVSTTNRNHGGSFMVVETVQLGYSIGNIANLSGAILPSLGHQLIVDNYGTVIGFWRYYNATPSQGGYLTVHASSCSGCFPSNTLSDSLSIQ